MGASWPGGQHQDILTKELQEVLRQQLETTKGHTVSGHV